MTKKNISMVHSGWSMDDNSNPNNNPKLDKSDRHTQKLDNSSELDKIFEKLWSTLNATASWEEAKQSVLELIASEVKKNLANYISKKDVLKIVGEDELQDPTHVSNQNKPYLRERQIRRNELRAEIRLKLGDL